MLVYYCIMHTSYAQSTCIQILLCAGKYTTLAGYCNIYCIMFGYCVRYCIYHVSLDTVFGNMDYLFSCCLNFWMYYQGSIKNYKQAVCCVQVLEQRVETLERELDAAISAAAHARAEKRQAEAAQKAAESRTQQITRELENTTSMFSESSFQL